jgi:hypothetical protein
MNLFRGVWLRVLTLDSGEDYLVAIGEIECLANIVLA